jgi:hypothetical protein
VANHGEVTDVRQDTNGRADPLYKALDKYEDAANAVGTLTICAQACYRKLTDAIGGHGDLAEARVSFQIEAALLADAHQQWSLAAQELIYQVADGLEWQQSFAIPRKRCPQCGDAWSAKDPWDHQGGCNNCWAQAHPDGNIVPLELIERAMEEAPPGIGPYRQFYGERGVVATEDL